MIFWKKLKDSDIVLPGDVYSEFNPNDKKPYARMSFVSSFRYHKKLGLEKLGYYRPIWIQTEAPVKLHHPTYDPETLLTDESDIQGN